MASITPTEFDALQAALADGRADAGAMVATLLARHHDAVSQALLKGLGFLAQGNAPQAYAAFLQASTLAPDTARAYLGLGQALFQLGHADKAIAASLQALRLDAGCCQAMLVIADCSAAMGQWPQAIAQYQAVLSTGAQSVFVHLGLGAALVQARRLAEAKDQFAQVIRLKPDHAVGYCNLGYALMTLGEYPEAIRLLQHALTLPGEARGMIHTNLADAYFSLGDFAAAEAQSRQAVALVPDFAPAHGIRAEALRALGRHADAIPHYRAHGTAEAHAKALESLYHLGDMDAFARAQEELAQTQPDNIRLAAIGADIAAKHGARYTSRFCADPLSAIAISNVMPKLEPFADFSTALLREAQMLDAVWEPPRKTTRGDTRPRATSSTWARPRSRS
jgi:tetratricopeptide (TPR) repeat protein